MVKEHVFTGKKFSCFSEQSLFAGIFFLLIRTGTRFSLRVSKFPLKIVYFQISNHYHLKLFANYTIFSYHTIIDKKKMIFKKNQLITFLKHSVFFESEIVHVNFKLYQDLDV